MERVEKPVSAHESQWVQRKILLSRLLTRSGDQAWDFVVPVTLITLLPAQISLVAFIYLLSKLGSVLIQPWLASVIDTWKRINTAVLGTCLQLSSVLLVTVCVFVLSAKSGPSTAILSEPIYWPLLLGITLGSVVSNLGAGLMDIAVGNDWIPTVIPAWQLPRVNSRLKQLDLLTEVMSPVVAGLLLAVTLPSVPLAGFLFVAAWNVFSFVPELFLLRNVFFGSKELQQATTSVPNTGRMSLVEKISVGWKEFSLQPAALVMLAYAFLWLSALSPHGVLLTSFLKGGWALSETSLGIFRGLGAVFGLLATLLFPKVRKRFGLVRGTWLFIGFQAVVLVLSLPFFYFRTANGLVFLALVLVSRVGLYGFSLGETEIRQRSIPEGQRGKVNGVATALTSLATLILFAAGTLIASPQWFYLMVLFSVCAVCVGAAIYLRWSQKSLAQEV